MTICLYRGGLICKAQIQKATIAETLKTKGIVCEDLAWGMVELANASIADIVIVLVQDILGLDAKARINTPGTVGSPNWEWKLENFFAFMKNWKLCPKSWRILEGGQAYERNLPDQEGSSGCISDYGGRLGAMYVSVRKNRQC